MDAHLFRRFCEVLTPRLTGARLEKLQEPAPGLLTLTFFKAGRKRQLCLRFGRKEPFCFLTEKRISAGHAPTARIMRLRKYAAERRIAACVTQFCARRLWLLLGGASGGRHGEGAAPGTSLWLLLDLREGPSLHFLEARETPAEDRPAWPTPENLDEACANWRQWPVLTPALRRTLTHLEKPEQWALLEDLRAGGGDIFLYGALFHKKGGESGPGPAAMSVRAVSAWPLPPALREGLEPLCAESGELENAQATAFPPQMPPGAVHGCRIPDLLERAGQSLVLERLAQENAAAAALPLDRRSRKIARLLCKLDEEEKRLGAMLAAKADALALRENLWRWPADLRAASLSVPVDAASAGPGEAPREAGQAPMRQIRLDPRRTVREEMEALFHRARRGQRGLEHLAARRAALEEEAAALRRARRELLPGSHGAAMPGGRTQSAGKAPAPTPGRTLPKNVQLFVSADGFALLRGRDARGNLAALRLAAPHDIWLHAESGPGAHVIIRRAHGGQDVPERTLDQAGALAACKSRQRDAARARILYAEVRHVKPLRNAPAGTVRVDRVFSSREVPVDCELETLLLPAF